MAYPIKGIHRRIFPRGREVGLTIETYDDRPHLSELLQWRAARPRAWSGHASIPSSPLTSGSGIPPASGPLETGIQPPLTPVGSPISPLAPSKVSPARQADPSPSRPVTSRLLAQIKQTCMPTGFQQNLTPPKLNSAQRKAKREQLRTHKWILDIENERRWRTGMRRLMDEVYDFQEASMSVTIDTCGPVCLSEEVTLTGTGLNPTNGSLARASFCQITTMRRCKPCEHRTKHSPAYARCPRQNLQSID